MNEQRINEIIGFIFLAFGALMLMSLLTYDVNDLSIFTSTPNDRIHNFAGIIGAYVAGFIFFLIGKSGYIIPVMCLIWAVNKFTATKPQKFYIKISGTIVLFLALSSLLSLVFNDSNADKVSAGGMAGMLFSGLLEKYCGVGGAYTIAITLLVLAVLLTTEFLIVPFVLMLFARYWKKPKVQISRPKITTPKPIITKTGIQPISKPVMPEPAGPPKIKIDSVEKKPFSVKVSEKKAGEYKFPSLDLLDTPPPVEERRIKEDLEASSAVLEDTLRDFGIEVRVAEVEKGPVITRYELEPSPGVKVTRITSLSDDIALTMKAQSVRIIAPIPGKSRIGVEVPNTTASLVYLKEVLDSPEFRSAEGRLPLALGKDTAGTPVICDLAKMPHLLIAGTTGSGKTVCVNAIILSMIYGMSPDDLKFILVDPKMVELSMYNKLPHLICPVVTQPKKVSAALGWVVSEMESRYRLFAKLAVRNIEIYNQKVKNGDFKDDPDAPERMPYIVVIIDELADLMAIASQEIETAITRLAQLSRAVGIHIILATQRPSVDVITGVIKANFPARISFKVASKVDSRTVLDMNGADKLLGRGDMLFLEPGVAKPARAQSSLVSDKEIERVVDFIAAQRKAEYIDEVAKEDEKKKFGSGAEKDEFYDDAVRMVMETGLASVSMLQRRMRLSHTRAARLIDTMEEEGMVGPYRGSKPREILIDPKAYLEGEIVKQPAGAKEEEPQGQNELKEEEKV